MVDIYPIVYLIYHYRFDTSQVVGPRISKPSTYRTQPGHSGHRDEFGCGACDQGITQSGGEME